MRWPIRWSVLLALCVIAPGSLLFAQNETPARDGAKSASQAATEEEVQQLRQEVADLKAMIQKLVQTSAPAGAGNAHLITANFPQPATEAEADSEAAEPPAEPYAMLSQKKESAAPVTAGWNGEHFYIKSADGQFQIQPYGYVQTDYRTYIGDGAPPNTFTLRRGRFGFQGNYGDHYQFGILLDAAATSGATIRDVYLNVNINKKFQFQAGQFKEPFAQELVTGVTNLDFMDRGLQALLYPSAASAFRSPGVTIHGDLKGGEIQYWGGAFNGKGYSTISNTTSVPEAIGRLRFYPWRNKPDSRLRGLAFGGSIAYSFSRGLSNEQTPPMNMPDGAYFWFPQFPVNGNVWRYEGEFTYLRGPWGIRGEYVLANWDRTGVGTEQLGGLGFSNLPNIRFQAWNSAITYLLTGENRPENGTPRVKHPVFGPKTEASGGDRGWGAWELGFRYSGIQGNEPGVFFNNVQTPQLVPTFNQHTDQFTFGVNWYLNYWVRFQSNIDVDRLKQPSTIGAVPQKYVVFEERLQFRF